MAIAALTQILDWQIPRTAARLRHSTGRIETWAHEHRLEPLPAAERGPHPLEVGIPAAAMPRVPERLNQDGVFLGVRGATGRRISPHLYTTDADLDRLFEALTRALKA